MIVEIEDPRPSCRSALDYNERKVSKGTAELVAFCNIDDTRKDAVYALFERYERTRYPIKCMSFHASVNPSESDECTERQVIEFISELMEHMGYARQPYLVYRHFDIDRIHYHIVSVRADRNGRKIECLYEKRRITAFMKNVADKYSFKMALKGEGARSRRDLSSESDIRRMIRFDPTAGDVSEQLRKIFSQALQYDFDGYEQLCRVLQDLGVQAARIETDGEPMMTLRGLDAEGKPCTGVLSENALGIPLYEQCLSASVAHKQEHRLRHREKERLASLVTAAFRYSKSQAHFENILKNKGVTMHLSKSVDGMVFGLTFVDHRTRTVFKASEMPNVISPAMMHDAVDSGHWRALDKGYDRYEYRHNAVSDAQIAAQVLRNIGAGVISRNVTQAETVRGASWSGKAPKSEEELEEEYQIGRTGTLNFNFEDHSLEDHIS